MSTATLSRDPSEAKGRNGNLDILSEQVLTTLDIAGEDGLTVIEIAQFLDQPRDSISPRMQPLVKQGRVRDTGLKRVPDGYRVKATIWAVTKPGMSS